MTWGFNSHASCGAILPITEQQKIFFCSKMICILDAATGEEHNEAHEKRTEWILLFLLQFKKKKERNVHLICYFEVEVVIKLILSM